jgi:ankyrin repeat protein
MQHGSELPTELLHIAAGTDKLKVLNFLLSIGYDVNGTNGFGETPLHIACKNKALESVVEYLLQKGADPNIPNNLGDTAASIA